MKNEDEQLTLRRLLLIKNLYIIDVNQSSKNNGQEVFAILSFHDCIEMFLKFTAERNNINSSNLNFMQYWEKIPELTLKETMKQLNATRVNLKHRGLIPATSEIERFRFYTTDFLIHNTTTQFGVDFEQISLREIIKYKSVKDYIIKSENSLSEGNYTSAIENIAYAFNELIKEYQDNKISWQSDPFFFGGESRMISRLEKKLDETNDIINTINVISKSVSYIQEALKILSLGIDYREFQKFKILTPTVSRTVGGKMIAEIYGKKKWSKDNCQYCIDFVIDTALKFQSFDFDVSHLIDDHEGEILIDIN
ncbi:hypothetical protein GCM10009117_17830 [Gangjinia marincola]|uniref:Apea-like HEPN domain-containing protein n=1 Tax=Gangjinia marincola TaxID=578463 RepID=A0ABP3XTK0_9FLAO